ncbi:SLC13 family permease [Paenibacillus sp. J2TS4]|uniref:SLC13 family permease n=1 Tax=Paenibacillus sp. J2TS4 TaxID=2807194 RepID=UPI001B20392A|nr:SLC13 family permease [Paenibacillus sp. J2TS4]GIP34090.1 SLC13 family permease [Paenibacillus sp. J2TS4]
MNAQMIVTLLLLGAASILFIIGKVRSDLVALCSLVVLVLLGILTPGEALAGFSNSVVVMMIGLFVVGGGIFQTGLARMASQQLLKLAGPHEMRLLLMVMAVTALLSAFISNTGTVAVMLPIVVSLAAEIGMSPARLLMPLAFASSLGGTLTLIGTPPNLVISETLTRFGYEKLSFFAFTPIGLAALIIGMILLIGLTKLFLGTKNAEGADKEPRRRSMQELAKHYQLAQNLFRVRVRQDAGITQKSLLDLEIPSKYGVHILEVRRKQSRKNPFFKSLAPEIAGPRTVIQPDDILYVRGSMEQVKHFADSCGLELMDPQQTERMNRNETGTLLSQEGGIAEVLLTPDSKFINQRIQESGFREKYGLNILGIMRKGKYILHNLNEEKMRFGDALLVQGAWQKIQWLSRETTDFVVVGQPMEEAGTMTRNHKAPVAAGIMLMMLILMTLEVFPAVITVMLAAILMVATGCLRNMQEAYNTINWESIVLIAGMIPMSSALEKTGAAQYISESLVQGLGGFGPLVLLAGIYFVTSFLTLFISNTATAVLFAPIAATAAIQMGISPYPFLFAVSLAASMAFATPVASPTNALVMASGGYSFGDYVKIGLPLQLLIGILMVLLLPVFFPF